MAIPKLKCEQDGIYARFWWRSAPGPKGRQYINRKLVNDPKKDHEAILELGKLIEQLESKSYLPPRATIKKAMPMNLIRLKGKPGATDSIGKLNKHIIPFFGGLKVEEIDRDKIVEYIEMRETSSDAAKNTLKMELRELKNLIRCVHKKYELPEKLSFSNLPKKVSRALTYDQVIHVAKFVKQQSPEFGEIYEIIYWICAYTGMDVGDILKLCPTNIQDGMIVVERGRGKTGVEFSLPICKPLSAVFRSIKVLNLDLALPYFQAVNSKQVCVAIIRAFKTAKVKGSSKSLRHFLTSMLANEGLSETLIRKAIGHAPGSSITDGYIHPYDDTLRDAFKVFDK